MASGLGFAAQAAQMMNLGSNYFNQFPNSRANPTGGVQNQPGWDTWASAAPYMNYADTGTTATPGYTGTLDPSGPNARYSTQGRYDYYKTHPTPAVDDPRTATLAAGQEIPGRGAAATGSLASTPPAAGATGTLATPAAGGNAYSANGQDPRAAYALTHPNWHGEGTPWLTETVGTPPVTSTGGGVTTGPATGGTGTNPNFDINNGNANAGGLGFGVLPAPVAPPVIGPAATVGTPPQITAPTVTAAQGGFNDFNAMENAAYHNAYDPVAQESQRQQALADDRLNAELAQAGVSSSGTGIDARQRQATEYQQQRLTASTNAANAAMVQRYGLEYQQSQDNAQLRQQASLANAGFNYNAQADNARNFLTAGTANAGFQNARDLANAQNYLTAMGLTAAQEHQARSDFLGLMGLQEQDLARMDDFNLQNLSLAYNTYLKQLGIMVAAGQVSFGKTDGSQSSQQGSINLNLGG